MTNTNLLKSVIVAKGYTQEQIAELLGLSNATFNYKLNNKTEFKASEIKKLSEFLHLTEEETCSIFFAN